VRYEPIRILGMVGSTPRKLVLTAVARQKGRTGVRLGRMRTHLVLPLPLPRQTLSFVVLFGGRVRVEGQSSESQPADIRPRRRSLKLGAPIGAGQARLAITSIAPEGHAKYANTAG